MTDSPKIAYSFKHDLSDNIYLQLSDNTFRFLQILKSVTRMKIKMQQHLFNL